MLIVDSHRLLYFKINVDHRWSLNVGHNLTIIDDHNQLRKQYWLTYDPPNHRWIFYINTCRRCSSVIIDDWNFVYSIIDDDNWSCFSHWWWSLAFDDHWNPTFHDKTWPTQYLNYLNWCRYSLILLRYKRISVRRCSTQPKYKQKESGAPDYLYFYIKTPLIVYFALLLSYYYYFILIQ